MPELPEVETVRRTLKNFVLHKTIDSIEVRYPRIIDGDVETFVSTLIHQSICDIDRYGKYLIFILDHDAFISHLRMEGKYNIKQKDEPYDKHDHIIFHMTDGTDLRYNDTRKFGRMQLVDKNTIVNIHHLIAWVRNQWMLLLITSILVFIKVICLSNNYY